MAAEEEAGQLLTAPENNFRTVFYWDGFFSHVTQLSVDLEILFVNGGLPFWSVGNKISSSSSAICVFLFLRFSTRL